MTPSELNAKLLMWPEEARPTFLANSKYFDAESYYSGMDEDDGKYNEISIEDGTDLACMSGLRWLKKQPGVSSVCMSKKEDGETVSLARPRAAGFGISYKHYSGPTEFDAIHAAIIDTKEKA